MSNLVGLGDYRNLHGRDDAMNFHPRATEIIKGKSYRNARKILRALGCTHAEQNAIISAAKKEGKIRLPNAGN